MAGRRRLPDLPAQLRRRERRRHRRPPGHHRAAAATSRSWASTRSGSSRSTRRRWPTAATTSPTTATSTPARHAGRLRRPGRATPHARGIRVHRRHRAEPHLRPASLVPRGARRRPGSPARERYIFRDGTWTRRRRAADGLALALRRQPPGSACPTAQWYCHLFAREQPDLNWDNPEVREDFLDTLRFWADRGVDGFRVDVAHALAKDLSEPARAASPTSTVRLPLDGSDPLYDRDEVHDIYRDWRTVFNEYDPPRMAVAETWHPTSARTYLYARPDRARPGLRLLPAQSRLGRATSSPASSSGRMADHRGRRRRRSTWVLSSHDVPRHATRYALPTESTSTPG